MSGGRQREEKRRDTTQPQVTMLSPNFRQKDGNLIVVNYIQLLDKVELILVNKKKIKEYQHEKRGF